MNIYIFYYGLEVKSYVDAKGTSLQSRREDLGELREFRQDIISTRKIMCLLDMINYKYRFQGWVQAVFLLTCMQ